MGRQGERRRRRFWSRFEEALARRVAIVLQNVESCGQPSPGQRSAPLPGTPGEVASAPGFAAPNLRPGGEGGVACLALFSLSPANRRSEYCPPRARAPCSRASGWAPAHGGRDLPWPQCSACARRGRTAARAWGSPGADAPPRRRWPCCCPPGACARSGPAAGGTCGGSWLIPGPPAWRPCARATALLTSQWSRQC